VAILDTPCGLVKSSRVCQTVHFDLSLCRRAPCGGDWLTQKISFERPYTHWAMGCPSSSHSSPSLHNSDQYGQIYTDHKPFDAARNILRRLGPDLCRCVILHSHSCHHTPVDRQFAPPFSMLGCSGVDGYRSWSERSLDPPGRSQHDLEDCGGTRLRRTAGFVSGRSFARSAQVLYARNLSKMSLLHKRSTRSQGGPR